MNEITIYKMRQRKMLKEEFSRLARGLEIREGKQVETDEALAIHDNKHALAYSQPGGKFGGLLFYIDQTQNIATPSENLIDPRRAKNWSDEFFSKYKFAPKIAEGQKTILSFEMFAYQSKGLTFDGKERKNIKFATEVASKITINDIPVTGPRAKVRMVFKNKYHPISIHSAIWQNLEPFEQREFVRPHEIHTVIKERLSKRNGDKRSFDVLEEKVAYFAHEYSGGPDLLAPYYFIDVEYTDPYAEKAAQIQGPRQVFWIPAYR